MDIALQIFCKKNTEVYNMALGRSGVVVMKGSATYTQLFSAGSGPRYMSGFQNQVIVQQDGNGTVAVEPAMGLSLQPLHLFMHNTTLRWPNNPALLVMG